MKALFCLYSAPLIESAHASSTPLAGNLRRGRARGRQGNGGGGQKPPSCRGKHHQGRGLAEGTALPCFQRRTVRGGEGGGCLWPRYPAPRELGEQGGHRKGREQNATLGRRGAWTRGGEISSSSPPASRQSHASSLCSLPSPACRGLSISSTTPGTLPTPHHDDPSLRGWRHPTCAPTAPRPRRASRAQAKKYFGAIPPHPALPLACEEAQPGSLLPEHNRGALRKAHRGSYNKLESSFLQLKRPGVDRMGTRFHSSDFYNNTSGESLAKFGPNIISLHSY